jgi:hypothetical protein
MSSSQDYLPSYLRYAECRARRIGSIGARFNSLQGFNPRNLDPWDRLLRPGAYGFCIRCLATALAASLAPREFPPTRIRLGIQVRARRIFPTSIFVSPRRPSFILGVTLIPMETLMTGPISPAGCTFAAFASNVRPRTTRIRPLYPDLLQASLLFSACMYFCMALNLQ